MASSTATKPREKSKADEMDSDAEAEVSNPKAKKASVSKAVQMKKPTSTKVTNYDPSELPALSFDDLLAHANVIYRRLSARKLKLVVAIVTSY